MFGWIIIGIAVVGFLITLHHFVKKIVTYHIIKDVDYRLKHK
jgi:hypothetical protein